MTSKQAILFPGQGAQRSGMKTVVFDIWPDLLAKADEISGFSIREFFLNCPADRFRNTRYVQPALYTINALYYLHYTEEGNHPPFFLAGHSLGEFNALLCAGVFDFETGLHLVNRRAQLMSEIAGGGMAAVLGLDAEEVVQVLARNRQLNLSIANLNADFQIVISGPIESIHLAEEVFYDNDAVKYVVLNVSGAFHSSMLNHAAARFGEYVESFSFSTPQIPVIANRTARPYSASSVVRNLSEHINKPVMWRQSVMYMRTHGVNDFVEIGDSSILLDMIKNIELK
ncbi:ACP S-malonyltransferase [Sodalis sp. RH16]|uniref:ACP S-malonyltransferase n=1 Tax=unclassified Sodalis (in: enterobacteria) TaxID=2636512 RepID=UPI0039B5A6D7